MRTRIILALAIVTFAAASITTDGIADPALSGTSEEFTFRNGDVVLSGTLHRPPGTGRHPAIVAFHSASGGTRDHHAHLMETGPPDSGGPISGDYLQQLLGWLRETTVAAGDHAGALSSLAFNAPC